MVKPISIAQPTPKVIPSIYSEPPRFIYYYYFQKPYY
jgi:hypothetical protein